MLFQCIEDTWSVSVFVSGIKSEVDFFFIGIFSIVGMILAKIVDRGMAQDYSWKNSAKQYEEMYTWLAGY